MLDNKRTTPIIALIGAVALLMSSPAFAQTAAPSAAPAAASGASAAPASSAAPADSAAAPAAGSDQAPATIKDAGKLGPLTMFLNATVVVKTVIGGLFLATVFSWFLLITKLLELGALNRESDKFLEAFRGARSVADINRIATSEEFEGNPMADMAAAAATE